ncbi:MAG TPA: hypothetical protein VFK88_09650, partial [Gallionella sp.]|nr:hypothetical protein [Gallionella sp.]
TRRPPRLSKGRMVQNGRLKAVGSYEEGRHIKGSTGSASCRSQEVARYLTPTVNFKYRFGPKPDQN